MGLGRSIQVLQGHHAFPARWILLYKICFFLIKRRSQTRQRNDESDWAGCKSVLQGELFPLPSNDVGTNSPAWSFTNTFQPRCLGLSVANSMISKPEEGSIFDRVIQQTPLARLSNNLIAISTTILGLVFILFWYAHNLHETLPAPGSSGSFFAVQIQHAGWCTMH